MPEYKELEALKKAIHVSDLNNREKMALLLCVGAVPSAEVAPVVHGQWKNGCPICPVCGMDKFSGLDADIWSDWQPKHCPNCGAKMDGGMADG